MNTHTPAPWKVDDGNFVYALNEQGINIFSCCVQGGYTNGKRTTREELEANAALIAAAPAMYEALKVTKHALVALERATGHHAGDYQIKLIEKAERLYVEALRLAEGRG